MASRQLLTDRFLADLEREILGFSARIERNQGNPVICIGSAFRINVRSQWRLIDSEGVVVTDTDDGQWFGLSAPVDAPSLATERLVGRKVEFCEFDACTGDLRIYFDGSLRLEILTNSSGYESWVMFLKGEHFAVGANRGLV